jgi:hypothetical protein
VGLRRLVTRFHKVGAHEEHPARFAHSTVHIEPILGALFTREPQLREHARLRDDTGEMDHRPSVGIVEEIRGLIERELVLDGTVPGDDENSPKPGLAELTCDVHEHRSQRREVKVVGAREDVLLGDLIGAAITDWKLREDQHGPTGPGDDRLGNATGEILVRVSVRVRWQVGPVLFQNAAPYDHDGLLQVETREVGRVHLAHVVDLSRRGERCEKLQPTEYCREGDESHRSLQE